MSNDLFSVSGKTAVVTGGTGVLGSEMVRGLANAGANVVIVGRRAEAGEKIINQLQFAKGKVIFEKADVLREEDLRAANKSVLNTFGSIDILINAAGGNLAGAVIPADRNFFDLNMGEFQKVVDLNLNGTVLPTMIFAKDMAARKQGVIINIASMASFRSLTRVVGYSASKAAVVNFTEWLAVEMAKKYGDGIRVNAIAPGFFLTEQNKDLLTTADGGYTRRGESVIRSTPYARFGKPEELIGTLLWLCSDASRFVTGVTVPVDGGFNAFGGV